MQLPLSTRASTRRWTHFLLAACILAEWGCTSSGSEDGTETPSDGTPTATPEEDTATPTAGFRLVSPTFAEGEALPLANRCERDGGSDLSPPLDWSGAPEGTTAYVLTLHHYPGGSDPDKDTPNAYWLLWNIPANVLSLSEGNIESRGNEGSNKDGTGTGYTPPCPPDDVVHWYTITIYALSEDPSALGTEDTLEVDWTVLTTAIEDLTLGTATLMFST